MGASGWVYYCPYEADTNAALQTLRQAVFDRREYSLPGDLIDGMDDATLNSVAPPTADLKKLLKISQALDQALGGLGLDTNESTKQTGAVEKMMQKIDKAGFAAAAREALKPKDAPPTTIDELLEQCAEAGTHSILDIEGVSPAPELGAATPLSESQLQTLFGTTEPTKTMIQTAEQDGRLHALCDRWQAVYLTVYEDGQPVEYVFAGVSGD
ncbi:hypothetical protein [uncultured Gimesia sp.]|uniref:hypothetical protein n=1 Tax=uncultured Gimesia sp. TaxID=1678688 RepID=UPI0030DC0331|tara:strand:+ start:39275 stop:39910 length:636 start_codon:yes stop_codon:yes gene_type:complete